MIDNRSVMGRNIQHYMDKNGMTATDVCKALDFKQNTFSDWVNGKTYPRIDAIEKLANFFGINKAFLVEDIREMEYISPEERRIIDSYRKLNAYSQAMIKKMLDIESEPLPGQTSLFDMVDKEGKQ